MKKISVLVILLVIMQFLSSCNLFNNHENESYENYVIMVSFDGFRWDYPDMYDTPNFDELAAEGVKAESMSASFPTKTFPNHYTLATGLYPDHHGIINNSFLATDLGGLIYRIGNREMVENPDFYGGEPIWLTAENQDMISACFYWVGSEAPIGGIRPSYWKKYDQSVANSDRIDTVIKWLKYPLIKRPRLITLYFHEPDWHGHKYGPVSDETKIVVEEQDGVLGELVTKLKELPYYDKINLIVLSDHGMGEVSSDKYVKLNNYIDSTWITSLLGSNPFFLLDAVDSYRDTAVKVLDNLEGVTAWKKEDIPDYLDYGTHSRVTDVVVVADSGWSIGTRDQMNNKGTHGYDHTNKDMHAIFYADGPAFKDNYIQPSFQNVNIYPLIAYILGLEPAETDGNLEEVLGMLISH